MTQRAMIDEELPIEVHYEMGETRDGRRKYRLRVRLWDGTEHCTPAYDTKEEALKTSKILIAGLLRVGGIEVDGAARA